MALENPVIGVHAAEIAERALSQALPTLFALEQAGAGGLLSYGTSHGKAAHQMARHASLLLKGETATAIPIETLLCPDLVIDMRSARRLGLTIAAEVLRRSSRVIE